MEIYRLSRDFIEESEIIGDIAPTVLYLLEIKIPDYIDGKILKKLMKLININYKIEKFFFLVYLKYLFVNINRKILLRKRVK